MSSRNRYRPAKQLNQRLSWRTAWELGGALSLSPALPPSPLLCPLSLSAGLRRGWDWKTLWVEAWGALPEQDLGPPRSRGVGGPAVEGTCQGKWNISKVKSIRASEALKTTARGIAGKVGQVTREGFWEQGQDGEGNVLRERGRGDWDRS